MNQVLEKLAWMAIPLLISAVTYTWTTVQTTKEKLQELTISSELAREKIKHEILQQAIANRERIVLLEEKVSSLEGQIKK